MRPECSTPALCSFFFVLHRRGVGCRDTLVPAAPPIAAPPRSLDDMELAGAPQIPFVSNAMPQQLPRVSLPTPTVCTARVVPGGARVRTHQCLLYIVARLLLAFACARWSHVAQQLLLCTALSALLLFG